MRAEKSIETHDLRISYSESEPTEAPVVLLLQGWLDGTST